MKIYKFKRRKKSGNHSFVLTEPEKHRFVNLFRIQSGTIYPTNLESNNVERHTYRKSKCPKSNECICRKVELLKTKGKGSRNLPHPHSHLYISTHILIFVVDIFIFRQLYISIKLGVTFQNVLSYSSHTSYLMCIKFLIYLIKKNRVLWAKLEISLGVQTGKTFLWKNNSLSHFPERKMCSAEKRELQKIINYF